MASKRFETVTVFTQVFKKVFDCMKQEMNIAIRNLSKYVSPIFSGSKKNWVFAYFPQVFLIVTCLIDSYCLITSYHSCPILLTYSQKSKKLTLNISIVTISNTISTKELTKKEGLNV